MRVNEALYLRRDHSWSFISNEKELLPNVETIRWPVRSAGALVTWLFTLPDVLYVRREVVQNPVRVVNNPVRYARCPVGSTRGK